MIYIDELRLELSLTLNSPKNYAKRITFISKIRSLNILMPIYCSEILQNSQFSKFNPF